MNVEKSFVFKQMLKKTLFQFLLMLLKLVQILLNDFFLMTCYCAIHFFFSIYLSNQNVFSESILTTIVNFFSITHLLLF